MSVIAPIVDAETGRTDVAAMMREASKPQHEAAENRSFVTQLMHGQLDLEAYVRYLGQLAWVYEALEGRTVSGDQPAIFDPELHRFAAIERDLAALGVADWRSAHPMLPATKAYVERLTVIRDDLVPYLAHHYTRYLGDLSGGQAIAKLVARHYGVTAEQSAFYDFGNLGADPVPYKRAYREAINGFGFDSDTIDRLIEEVQLAFELNGALFDELAGS